MSEIVSKPYRPDAEMCCKACAFGGMEHGGRYEHAAWCQSFAARTWLAMATMLVESSIGAELRRGTK